MWGVIPGGEQSTCQGPEVGAGERTSRLACTDPVYRGHCSLAQASFAVPAATPCCLAPTLQKEPNGEHLHIIYFLRIASDM